MNHNSHRDDSPLRRRRGWTPMWLKLMLTLGGLSVSSLMADGKLSDDLKPPAAGSAVDVIVQFKDAPTEADLAEIARLGGTLKARLPHIRGAVFAGSASLVRGLAVHPRVAYASPDRKVSGSLQFAQAAVGANIALQYGWDGA